jgi:hypothetical protein
VKLDAGTFLLQWAAGGLLFGWVTTRRREVSLGYGWLIRIVFGLMAAGAFALFVANDHGVAAAFALACALASAGALVVSVVRRGAGVRGREEKRAERRARVATMLGRLEEEAEASGAPEFPPVLDLVAALLGCAGLLAAAQFAGGPYALAARDCSSAPRSSVR